jgi:hypothetical protein
LRGLPVFLVCGSTTTGQYQALWQGALGAVARLPRQGLQASSAIPLELQDGTVGKRESACTLVLGLDQVTPLCVPEKQLERIDLTGHSLKTDSAPEPLKRLVVSEKV